jgi:hypothetical protein
MREVEISEKYDASYPSRSELSPPDASGVVN